MSERKKKTLPKVEDSETYDWVDSDVQIRASLFSDVDSVGRVVLSRIVKPGFRLELLPCSRSDRVYHRRKDFESFYMYSPVLEELHVKLPFSSFECDVMTQMNCAPSQIHPNGWAFIKCFEILMEFLEVETDLELFFSLFQVKGVWKGLWINLNSTPGFSVFKLYKSSFKDFKEMFLKVKSVDEEFPFYLDEHLGEKFPMYWCCQPNHILGPELISDRNECILSFLIEMVDKGGLVSVSELLPWEDDRSAVLDYLVGKYPGVSASSLRSRFKAKNFEGSSSNLEKVDGGAEVNQPPKKKGIVFKKRKTDLVELDGGGSKQEMLSLEDLSSFTLKQEKLHTFDNEGESSSVWCPKFSFNVVADEVVQSSTDVSLVEEVGDIGVDQFLQVLGFRLASIGRSQEKKHKKLSNDASAAVALKEELLLKDKSLSDLKEKFAEVESELKGEKEGREKTVKLLAKKEEDLISLGNQVIELTSKMKEMESAKEGDILDAFAEGFERAVTQAKFLVPEADFSAMDPGKIIREGELVDDEEAAEEGDDNLAD
ncbi:uncharacterized protein [Arachis hypogaea]|uniref:uncharacterized protein n=1 Tax=Arachis hypogaea TaxID=3818 RepID=UPI003B21CFF4